MYVQPSAPRDIGGVIDDAIKLYRASFRSCWPIALISTAVTIAAVIYFVARIPMLATLRDPVQVWQQFRSPSLWGWFPIFSIISLAVFAAVIAAQVSVASGKGPMSLGQALAAGFGRLHWLLLGMLLVLLYTAAVLISVLPIGVLLRIVVVLAWLVYGIFLWGMLQLWIVALYAEDASTLEAMRSSWTLIRGHWWRTSIIVTVGIIIVIVLTIVFSVLSGLAMVMFPADPVSMLLRTQIVAALERVFIMPMLPALLVAMYYDYKIRREGADLAARTKSLQPA
ncbi:MAG TPA: hypothetical protein VGL28_07495 [Steroidobacteraceae bacterium]|jgi:hypothetical protein